MRSWVHLALQIILVLITLILITLILILILILLLIIIIIVKCVHNLQYKKRLTCEQCKSPFTRNTEKHSVDRY